MGSTTGKIKKAITNTTAKEKASLSPLTLIHRTHYLDASDLLVNWIKEQEMISIPIIYIPVPIRVS
jgi:hypothetical protein